MQRKVTTIGEKPLGYQPTSVPQAPAVGRKPTVIGGREPAPPGGSPTVIGTPTKRYTPTVISQAVASPAPATRHGPTVIPGSVAPAPAAPRAVERSKDWKPTSLPGVQVDIAHVDLAALESQFPQERATVLAEVRRLLTGGSLTAGAPFWIGFGLGVQESLSQAIKSRLTIVERPALRSATQHLARLHALLGDVVESLDGGLLRRSAHRVWQAVEPEIHQLEGLLRTSGSDLALVIGDLDKLKSSGGAVEQELEVIGRALEFSLERVPADVAGVVLSRLTSITGAQALYKEHVAYLELQVQQLQQMVSLILDGVLLKLPAVYGLLAALPPKPSETQRFLATEKLSELTKLIPR